VYGWLVAPLLPEIMAPMAAVLMQLMIALGC
jgi:hypothetical protein